MAASPAQEQEDRLRVWAPGSPDEDRPLIVALRRTVLPAVLLLLIVAFVVGLVIDRGSDHPIEVNAVLSQDGTSAAVTVAIACSAGEEVSVTVTVAQAQVEATGQHAEACTHRGSVRRSVDVKAARGGTLGPGAARACMAIAGRGRPAVDQPVCRVIRLAR